MIFSTRPATKPPGSRRWGDGLPVRYILAQWNLFHGCQQCKSLLRPRRAGNGYRASLTPSPFAALAATDERDQIKPLHPSLPSKGKHRDRHPPAYTFNQRIRASAHQRISASAHQRISASAPQRISASAHQRISASAHQRISASAHQRNPCHTERKAPCPPSSRSTGQSSKPTRWPPSGSLSPITSPYPSWARVGIPPSPSLAAPWRPSPSLLDL